MRLLPRLLVLVAVVTLTAGPVLALPVALGRGATVTAPAGSAPSSVRSLFTWVALGAGSLLALKVKDNAAITKKYVTRAGAAQSDYKTGVETAAGDWEQGAKNGEGNYEQGVQAAIGRKAYGKGIVGAGAKYRDNATKLGVARYPEGVRNAEGAYGSGVAPYLDLLRNLTLPPPGPRRSAANRDRANMVAIELGKKKEQG
jgi:hypothetical protein